jgi:hypothetical protein
MKSTSILQISLLKNLYKRILKNTYLSILNSLNPTLFSPKIIRLGRDNDGGYLILDNKKNYKYLLSFGISDDVSFEKDFSKKYSESKIFCFDPSINFLPETIPNAIFHKIGLDSKTGINYKKLIDVLKLIGIEENDYRNTFLKIDIEGYEWPVLSDRDSFNILCNFDQIAIEFHFKFLVRAKKILLPFFLIKRALIIKRLMKNFKSFNLHANNCAGSKAYTKYDDFIFPHVVEVSLLNNNNLKNFLHELNQPCDPKREDIQGFFDINSSLYNKNNF